MQLSWAEWSRCAVRIAFGMMRADPVPTGSPGLHGAVGHCAFMTVAAEPPAHCRLASGHDPCEMVAYEDCTARSRRIYATRRRLPPRKRSLLLTAYPTELRREG